MTAGRCFAKRAYFVQLIQQLYLNQCAHAAFLKARPRFLQNVRWLEFNKPKLLPPPPIVRRKGRCLDFLSQTESTHYSNAPLPKWL